MEPQQLELFCANSTYECYIREMFKVPTFVFVVIVVVVKLVDSFPTGRRIFQESFFKWSGGQQTKRSSGF